MIEPTAAFHEWDGAALGRDADVVHVMRLALDVRRGALASMHATLSEEETRRAASYKFEVDRARYVAAHGALRHILGRSLDVPAADVRLRIGEHGKPALSEEHGRPDLHFNLAHSGDRALVAVSSGREVGVDVERVRDELDHQAIAERFLGPTQAQALCASPEAERAERFTVAWTRMEACAKASGLGLGLMLGQPDEGDWEVVTLRPWDGHAGAVASRDRGWSLRLWDWSHV